MSMFKVNVIARDPKREELATKPLEELVDTGSERTWLPGGRFERRRYYSAPEADISPRAASPGR
jgi:hypothetical protein